MLAGGSLRSEVLPLDNSVSPRQRSIHACRCISVRLANVAPDSCEMENAGWDGSQFPVLGSQFLVSRALRRPRLARKARAVHRTSSLPKRFRDVPRCGGYRRPRQKPDAGQHRARWSPRFQDQPRSMIAIPLATAAWAERTGDGASPHSGGRRMQRRSSTAQLSADSILHTESLPRVSSGVWFGWRQCSIDARCASGAEQPQHSSTTYSA